MTTRSLASLIISPLLAAAVAAAEHPWQELNDPSAAEVAANFTNPPPEYGLTIWWDWDGVITEEVINRDLDAFQAKGIRVVTIEAGYGMSAPYLSPGWFETIQLAVEQAKRRGMRVWLVDEGKYPSGFAGGKFSAERPDLHMQALVVGERIEIAAGETLTRKLAPGLRACWPSIRWTKAAGRSSPMPANCGGPRRRGNGRFSSSSMLSGARRRAPSTI